MLNKPFQPMILKKSLNVPSDPRYIHQFKWDGHRLLLHYDQGNIRLFTREQNECTIQYPELTNLRLPVTSCILDGECIVLDGSTVPPLPSFESVMSRFQSSKAATIHRLQTEFPVHYVVWDCIYLNGTSMVSKPLEDRLALLRDILPVSPYLTLTPSYEDGQSLFQQVVRLGAEGVVSKPRHSPYRFGACSDHQAWLKTKNYQYAEVAISGMRKGKFGWRLLLNGKSVGVLEFPPPSDHAKAFYRVAMQLKRRETKEWIDLEPLLRCTVKFQCYTKTGMLRSPSFVSFSTPSLG